MHFKINITTLFHIALMACIYYITGKISFAVFSQDTIVTMAAFAPEGFSLAAVLIYGRKILPDISRSTDLGFRFRSYALGICWYLTYQHP